MSNSMPLIYALQGGIQGAETINDVRAEKARGKFAKTAYDINADSLRLQADDAARRGDEAAAQIRADALKVRGAQRAGFAGQGVDINTGTAAALQAETGAIGEADVVTLKNNAFREAWGLKAKANEVAREGRLEALESKNKRRMSLVTGGLNALSTYGKYKEYAKHSRTTVRPSARLGKRTVPVAPASYMKGRY